MRGTRSTERRLGGALLLAALASAGPAGAADRAGSETAEELFQRGRRLFDEGRLDQACAALARSDQIEPSVGTLGLLAACHEKQGRIATAVAEYKETAKRAAAVKDERGKYAADRAAKLDPDVPTLTIVVRERVLGLEVVRGGKPLAEGDLGAPAPVDPGEIEVLARAPGRNTWVTTIVLELRDRRTLEIPPLTAVEVEKPKVAPAPTGSGRLVLAAVAGGVGLAGLGVMTGFGLSAASKNSDSESEFEACRTSADACARGRELRGDAQTAATVATVGFAVGIAGLAAGTALLLTAPRGGAPAPGGERAWIRVDPGIGPQGGGVLVRGAF
jgi:hypothetical protein